MPYHNTPSNTRSSANLSSQQGFTLVEILTVMLVLVAIASITVEASKDFVFQQRYEVTKDRYAKIRKAIIGDPEQVINGMPNIEGFVKDVGRLPFALQELLNGNFCSDTRYFTQADCEGATPAHTWSATPNWQGPYIESTKAFSDEKAISDGWGNAGSGNYGWEVKHYSDCAARTVTTDINSAQCMSIQSIGAVSAGVYGDAYPDIASRLSIEETDWKININGINANVMASGIAGNCTISSQPTDQPTCELIGRTWTSTPPTDETECTALSGIWDSGSSSCSITGMCSGTAKPASKLGCESVGGNWNYDDSPVLCLKIGSETSSNQATIKEDGREHLLSFNFPTPIKLGKTSIGVYEYDSGVPECTSNEYKGVAAIEMNLIPNSTLPIINW